MVDTVKIWGVILLITSAMVARADERTAKTHYFGAFFGQSQLILGSEDRRTGGGFSYAYGRPEPQFKWKSIPAQLVIEGYTDHTHSHGVDTERSNDTLSYGVLTYGRWRWPVTKRRVGIYFDLGVGLQYANRSTSDLDSRINSTPMMGFGGVFQFGSQELLLGVRFLHISNAGTDKPNKGQNQLFITAAVRY